MTEVSRRTGPMRVGLVLGVLAVAALATGLALAVGAEFSSGATETGGGAYVSEAPLAFWEWHETALTAVPDPAPALVSVTEAEPTRLALFGGSYAINAPTAGQTAVAWTFDETTAAPRSTELVLTFANGLSGATTPISVYVETGARAPAGTLAFVFYWDAGTFAPAGLDIETMQATTEQCAAIGNCP